MGRSRLSARANVGPSRHAAPASCALVAAATVPWPLASNVTSTAAWAPITLRERPQDHLERVLQRAPLHQRHQGVVHPLGLNAQRLLLVSRPFEGDESLAEV